LSDQPLAAFAFVLVLFGLTAGGYGFGTWLGKTIAALLDRDRTVFGDWGGIIVGLLGFGLFFGYFFGRLFA
jgi:hypothetical protein